MTPSAHIQFKVTQLRIDKLLYVLESIWVLVLVLFVSALLPQLLFKYLFDGQTLTTAPKIFEYIPAVSFGVGVGFCAIAFISNIYRYHKITLLELELENKLKNICSDCNDMDCNCSCSTPKLAKAKKIEKTDLKKVTTKKNTPKR